MEELWFLLSALRITRRCDRINQEVLPNSALSDTPTSHRILHLLIDVQHVAGPTFPLVSSRAFVLVVCLEILLGSRVAARRLP